MRNLRHHVTKAMIGCPSPFNACADPVVCNGMGLYLRTSDDRVIEAHWWCGQCSDDERQTLDLACQLILGKAFSDIHSLGVEAFAAAGAEAVGDLRMTCVRVLLALEMALLDHQVKSRIAARVGHPIDATQQVKLAGWHGREGQQRLKRLLEEGLAHYKLRVPAIKTQEWTAFGTIEDCSRWVQSAVKTELLNEVMERCYPQHA